MIGMNVPVATSTFKYKFIILALVTIFAVLGWASISQADTSATVVVTVSDNTFAPDPITINEGDTIQWDYAGGGNAHNIVSSETPTSFRCADGCDGSGGDGTPSSSAWSSSLTFGSNTAGTYTYYCEIHGASDGSGMAGSIVILGPSTAVSMSNSAVQTQFGGLLMLGFALFAVMLGSAGVLVVLRSRR